MVRARKHLWVLVIPLLSLLMTTSASAQAIYKANGKSVMTLKGTSTLHDWTMTAKSFSSSGQFTLNPSNQLTAIDNFSLVLPVTNLKSTKESMDENAWEVLNYEDHKNISYKLTSAKVTPGSGNTFKVVAVGNLTISGVTRAITMNVDATVNADGSVTCTGSVPLKLSEFKIERPSFMLGTMKVGDALSLSYNVHFVK